MRLETSAARSLPVLNEEGSKIPEKEQALNLENLALEKIKGDISEEERLESYKILFEQNPDLAMELAKEERHFPIAALAESNFFYYQHSASQKMLDEILRALNHDRIKTDEFRAFAFIILDWAKKHIATDILHGAGGVIKKPQKYEKLDRLIELAGVQDPILEILLARPEEDDVSLRQSQLAIAETIYEWHREKRMKVPEGRNIIYQNAKADFSMRGEAGMKKYLTAHSQRIKDLPPHLLLDLHYMRYANYRQLEELEKYSSPKDRDAIDLGIAAVNKTRETIERGEPRPVVRGSARRVRRLALAMEKLLNPDRRVSERVAYAELKTALTKNVQERLGPEVKIAWEEGKDKVGIRLEVPSAKTEILPPLEFKYDVFPWAAWHFDNHIWTVTINSDFAKDGKPLELDDYKETKLGYANGHVAGFVKKRNNKWVFFWSDGKNYVEKEGEYKESDDPNADYRVCVIGGKIYGIATKENGKKILISEDRGQVGQEYVHIDESSLVDINGNIGFCARREPGEENIVFVEGRGEIVHNANRGRLVISDGSVVVSKKSDAIFFEGRGEVRYENYKHIYEVVDIEGRVAFHGLKKDGNNSVFVEGQGEIWSGKGHCDHLKNIHGKTAFILYDNTGQTVFLEGKGRIGEKYLRILKPFTIINGKLAFDAYKNNEERIVYIEGKGEVYTGGDTSPDSEYTDLREINNEAVFTVLDKHLKTSFIASEHQGKLDQYSFGSIENIFEENGQVYVIGLKEHKIVRKHIPELSVEPGTLNKQEQRMLELMRVLKLAIERPILRKDADVNKEKEYEAITKEFMQKAGPFFYEEDKKIRPARQVLDVFKKIAGAHKLWAVSSASEREELTADLKERWLGQYIRPEAGKEFDEEIEYLRDRLRGDTNTKRVDNPEHALSDFGESFLEGGDPQMAGEQIMRNPDGYQGFLVRNHYSGNGQPFRADDLVFLPLRRYRQKDRRNFVIDPVWRGKLKINLPGEGRVGKIYGKRGGALTELVNLGTVTSPIVEIKANNDYDEIIYETEQKHKQPIDEQIMISELRELYEKMPASVPDRFSVPLFPLTAELKAEVKKTAGMTVWEAVSYLQKLAQDSFYYDDHYGKWRKEAGRDIRRRMKRANIEGRKHNKQFAGVCAEANLLACQLLREAGILTGLADGFLVSGMSIKHTDAHAVSYAILPDASGRFDKYYIDGTPGAEGVGRLPDLSESQEKWRKEAQALEKEPPIEKEARIKDMIEYFKGELSLVSGDIEAILNGELQRVAKEGKRGHLDILQLMSIMRFSPLTKKHWELMEERTKKYILEEIENKGLRQDIEDEVQKQSLNIGEIILIELGKTVETYAEKYNMGTKRACAWFKELLKNQLEGVLNIEERALLNLAADYLETKISR